MPLEESGYPRDWLKVADKDWRRMGQALDDGDAEEAGFWLQQALEKYLKAYLLSKGWALRRVHDLEVLVNEASVHMPGLERYVGACRKISGYYLTERYPFMDSPLLTLEEVSGSRDEIVEFGGIDSAGVAVGMPERTDIRSILIIGAGPIVIGKGFEFQDSGVDNRTGAVRCRVPCDRATGGGSVKLSRVSRPARDRMRVVGNAFVWARARGRFCASGRRPV